MNQAGSYCCWFPWEPQEPDVGHLAADRRRLRRSKRHFRAEVNPADKGFDGHPVTVSLLYSWNRIRVRRG